VSALDRIRTDALQIVGIGPRAVSGALTDLRTIAELMQYLPALEDRLAAIETKLQSVDDEVTRMRKAVESIDGKVVMLDADLSERLDDVRRALHPLERFGRRGRRQPPADAPDA
jgi:predicted  nucleic acid-binding Zn-ribbon protein